MEIKKSGIVLRGAGLEKSVLVCPVPLETIRPNMGATTSGRPTSNYSWSGGMFQIKGSWKKGKAVTVTEVVKRGATVLPVSSTNGFVSGQRVEILVTVEVWWRSGPRQEQRGPRNILEYPRQEASEVAA